MTLCALKLNLTQFKINTLYLLLGIQSGGSPFQIIIQTYSQDATLLNVSPALKAVLAGAGPTFKEQQCRETSRKAPPISLHDEVALTKSTYLQGRQKLGRLNLRCMATQQAPQKQRVHFARAASQVVATRQIA